MKTTILRFVYRFINFLTDLTKGFPLFSRWKITLGSLLIGTTIASCKQQGASGEVKTSEPKKDTITDLSNCYASNVVADTTKEATPLLKELIYKAPVRQKPIDTLNIQKVYTVVDEQPEFPGGEEALDIFMKNNLEYPQIALETGVTGTVWVRFIVEIDGNLSHIKVEKKLLPFCDTAAVQVVKSMPKWKPGKIEGKAVRTYFTVPVIFSEKVLFMPPQDFPRITPTCYIGGLPIKSLKQRNKTQSEISESPDILASFPGGEEKMLQFIADNIKFPNTRIQGNMPDTILVLVTIDAQGKVIKPIVLNSFQKEFDEEAIRIISKMPKWKPAKENGKKVASYYKIPVKFNSR